jgi:hypothetical protein
MLKNRYLATIVMLLGVVGLAIGGAFIGISLQKNNFLVDQLRAQQITLGLSADQVAAGQLVDTAQEAQVAADTLASHLSNIAATYNDLMAANPSGRYDPSNPENLTYTAGLNMENSLNMVVLGFGVIQQTEATGATLAVLGVSILLIGVVLFRKNRLTSEVS